MLRLFPILISRYLFYLRSHKWSRQRLQAYQDHRLCKIVRHAGKNVPYYRKLFQEIGFEAEKFRGRVDMGKIPLLDKEVLRTREEEFMADNAEKYGITWDSTSGSTGTPLHLIVDDSTRVNKLIALIRSYHWAGYTFGKKTFSLQSYYLKNADTEYNGLYRVLRFDSNRLKKETALKVLMTINKIKPKFFMGFPFDFLMLSQFAAEAGMEINPPDSIVTYGETLSDKKRELLESAYKCKVYDYYSHHECAAMIAECKHNTKHLIEDFAYQEIVDENGEELTDGETGELVGTGLYNFAMPLIRYKTRDTVTMESNGWTCVCGRKFRIVRRIFGKQCDYLHTPDGRVLGAVMSHSIDQAKGMVMSQCVQDAVNHVWINMVTDSTFDENSLHELEKGLRKRLGNEMKIDFRKVSQLEKSRGGKTPFILSKIGNVYI